MYTQRPGWGEHTARGRPPSQRHTRCPPARRRDRSRLGCAAHDAADHAVDATPKRIAVGATPEAHRSWRDTGGASQLTRHRKRIAVGRTVPASRSSPGRIAARPGESPPALANRSPRIAGGGCESRSSCLLRSVAKRCRASVSGSTAICSEPRLPLTERVAWHRIPGSGDWHEAAYAAAQWSISEMTASPTRSSERRPRPPSSLRLYELRLCEQCSRWRAAPETSRMQCTHHCSRPRHRKSGTTSHTNAIDMTT
jgi:hypothetical protein